MALDEAIPVSERSLPARTAQELLERAEENEVSLDEAVRRAQACLKDYPAAAVIELLLGSMSTIQTDPRKRTGSRRRNATSQPVPFFSAELRYTVPEAAGLLKQSVSRTWINIRDGKLAVIRDGGRTFVPGSEIVRRSSLPPAQQSQCEAA